MAKLPTFDPIDFLIRWECGLSSTDKRYEIYERLVRNDDLSDEERRVVADIAKYREKLLNMPENEVNWLVQKAKNTLADAKEREHHFNQPPAIADRTIFEFWSKAAYWSTEEAVALMLGRNPEHVNSKSLRNSYGAPRLTNAFHNLLRLLERAKTARQIEYGEGPGAYLVWANRYQIAYPPELGEYVRLYGHPLRDWKRVAEEREQEIAALKATLAVGAAVPKPPTGVTTRERSSMLKLIIGMAIGGYRFDPKASRNPATSDIASDLAKLEIALDADTILKYLREAADHLPGNTSK